MASNFIALRPNNLARPKLKYGMVNIKKLPGQLLPVSASEEDRNQAIANRVNYRSRDGDLAPVIPAQPIRTT